MGTLGDQSLNFMQNKTLAESTTNGIDVFVFEVFTNKEYTYIGQADLAAEPYQELQADDQGQIRQVWMFPLKIRGGRPSVPVPEAAIAKQRARRERTVKRLSDQELHERARLARRTPGQRTAVTTTYQRDPNVVMWVKRAAKGKCQLCDHLAPFSDKDGEPYLECHYIEWLSEGGEDSIENAVALCPNCHRRMHILNLAKDVQKLKRIALKRV
jgi:5-methylcytosine-specific restriction protein A